MTEAEWLTCDDPAVMLECLGERARGRTLKLFLCACCRRLWPALQASRARFALLTAERYADGQTDASTLFVACAEGSQTDPADVAARNAAAGLIDAPRYVDLCSEQCADAAALVGIHDGAEEARWLERCAQADILRCLFGNPFHQVTFDQSWLAPTVRQLAAAIYDERAFDRLPVLADALEEAGCADVAVLSHCREPGPHARGCWVVDALTGRGRASGRGRRHE